MIHDKEIGDRFFEEIFLLVNTNMKVVLDISFPSLNNANSIFTEESSGRLTWKSYIIAGTLSITSRVELIDKHEFARAALDINLETFQIYVAALEVSEMAIHSF